jgi:DNA-binding response OmpR family regulator
MENNLEKKKVCIIDDEDYIREIYTVKLESEGFVVVSAGDGEEGLELIRQEKPHIVLLDMQMPIKNGLDVLEEMKKDSEMNTIPVVILSNVDDEKSVMKVGEFETRFYLIKALNSPQKVVDIVREILH